MKIAALRHPRRTSKSPINIIPVMTSTIEDKIKCREEKVIGEICVNTYFEVTKFISKKIKKFLNLKLKYDRSCSLKERVNHIRPLIVI